MDGPGLWLYRDATGEQHLVERRDQVPEDLRAGAQRVGALELGRVTTPSGLTGAVEAVTGAAVPGGVDAGSFALGFASAAALVLALVLARHAPGWVLRFVVLVAVGAVGVVGYFTFVRQQAGLPGVGTPERMIEDARDAARRASERTRSQAEQLRELE